MSEPIEVYPITSRYNDKNTLVLQEDGRTYKFEGDERWIRYGWHEDDPQSLTMVDPSGGPYISLGFRIGDREVTRIYRKEDGYYFTTQEVQHFKETSTP